jgi:polar amino acid transport system substrate-binding protein
MIFVSANVWAAPLIFVADEYPPYTYMENGRMTGIDVDIVSEICRRLRVEATFEAMPWKRVLKTVKDGNAAGIPSIYHTEERTEFLHFSSEPLYFAKTVIFARKDNPVKISGIEDTKGKTVGIMADYSYGSAFDEYAGMKKITCYEIKILARILDKGRINFAAADEMAYRFVSKNFGLRYNFKAVYTLTENPLYAGFSKKGLGSRAEILAEEFGKIIRQMKAEGKIEKIMDKYIY